MSGLQRQLKSYHFIAKEYFLPDSSMTTHINAKAKASFSFPDAPDDLLTQLNMETELR